MKHYVTLLILSALATPAFAVPSIGAVLNGASYRAAVAPGTWAALYGSGLAPSAMSAASVPLSTTLNTVGVTVAGVAAPLLYVSETQINFLIPFEVTQPAAGIVVVVPVVVTAGSAASTAYNMPLTHTAPAIFTVNNQGTGPADVFTANFQFVSTVHPSDVVIVYAAGLGATNPAASSTTGATGAASVIDGIDVYVGEQKLAGTNIIYAGLAPGFPGVYQLNLTIPAGLATDRIYLRQAGLQSNIAHVGIPVGKNVTKVSGSLQAIYPPTAPNTPPFNVPPLSGPVDWSVLFEAAAFGVTFTIQPSATTFTVAAVGEASANIITIDPKGGTYQQTATVPSIPTRFGDFSGTELTSVYDWANCNTTTIVCSPFPGQVIPLTRIAASIMQAQTQLPMPSAPPSGSATGSVTQSGSAGPGTFSVTLGGQTPLSTFGGWFSLVYGPFASYTSTLALYVDGQLVTTTTATYPLLHR